MLTMLAGYLGPSEALTAAGLIAAWLVLMCLKILAEELEFSVRKHRLHLEAERLRVKQMNRLKELGVKTRAR